MMAALREARITQTGRRSNGLNHTLPRRDGLRDRIVQAPVVAIVEVRQQIEERGSRAPGIAQRSQRSADDMPPAAQQSLVQPFDLVVQLRPREVLVSEGRVHQVV